MTGAVALADKQTVLQVAGCWLDPPVCLSAFKYIDDCHSVSTTDLNNAVIGRLHALQ